MATILDINTSISDMSPDEAMELIKKVRLSRRTPPPKKATTKKAAPNVSVDTLVSGASPEQISELIKILEGAS